MATTLRGGYDRKTVERALGTWRDCAAQRARAQARIDAGRPLEAEEPERLAKYAERLMTNLEALPGAPGAAAAGVMREALEAAAPRKKAGAKRRAALERVIGEAEEFLPVMFIGRAALAARAVGRIIDRETRFGFGTGFLVAPGVLMTNEHVLPGEGDAATAQVQFGYELDTGWTELRGHAFRLAPERLFLSDAELDFALVAVEARSEDAVDLAEFGHLPLVGVEGKIRIGQAVNIVQHPEGARKQVVFRDSVLKPFPEDPAWAAHYTGDTKPGSSGSPVFSDAWEVVALHHSGVPETDAAGAWLDVNGDPWDEDRDPGMTNVKWIANEGVRVSRLVERIAARRGEPQPAGRALLAELLALGERTAAAGAEMVPPPRRTGDSAAAPARPPAPRSAEPVAPDPVAPAPGTPAGAVSFTAPLTVTLSLGGGAAIAAAPPRGSAERRAAADYADRLGFDRGFLGLTVEPPRPEDGVRDDVAPLIGSDETELRYDHFSVLMSRDRRLALVSAGNLRLDAPFTAERRDPWGFDPRMDRAFQAGDEFYAGNDLDRGHLFRRADGAWGASPAEARRASDDTFHWTNIAPQHFVFNQSGQDPELSLWGLLENHVSREAEEDRLRVDVLNGPVFQDGDPVHRGLRIPQAYWKALAIRDPEGALRAYGFVLEQTQLLRDLPREAFDPGRFAVFQVRIDDLGARTGLDFRQLHAADVLEGAGAEERATSGAGVRIRALRDVVRARR